MGDGPSTQGGKRKRQSSADHPPQQYGRGALMRIKVHDFMTYCGTVIIEPGPRLNLMLGPNGTGKSSFVCALCIGLAGSTKLLGRADNLQDYVRRNCTSFFTEITLSGGSSARPTVVRRDVEKKDRGGHNGDSSRREGFESKWAIDGKSSTMEQVKALVSSFNIQFDNLCQFLPQDKVSAFAQMNPFQLLIETEKAIGDSALYNQHMQLIDLRKDIAIQTVECNSLSKKLKGLQEEHRKQQVAYDRFQERETLLREASLGGGGGDHTPPCIRGDGDDTPPCVRGDGDGTPPCIRGDGDGTPPCIRGGGGPHTSLHPGGTGTTHLLASGGDGMEPGGGGGEGTSASRLIDATPPQRQAIAWRVTAQLVPACSKATQQALCVSASNLVSVRAQAELLRKLKAHLDAKTTQAELKRSLDDVRVVAGHLEAEKAKQQEDATPTRELSVRKAKASEKQRVTMQKANAIGAKLDELVAQISTWDTDLRTATVALSSLQAKSNERQRRMEEARHKLEAGKKEYDNAPTSAPEEVTCNIAAVEGVIKELSAKRRGLYEERDQKAHTMSGLQRDLTQVQGRLAHLSNEKEQKLDQLERTPWVRNIGKLYHWVKNNPQRFKKQVYGPIVLEISSIDTTDRNSAVYLDNQIGKHLHYFVTMCREDETTLSDQIRVLGTTTTVLNYGKNPDVVMQYPNGHASQFAGLGITATMDQLFQAPNVIKLVLAHQCKINRTYIGSTLAYDKSDEICNTTAVGSVYHPRGKFSVSRSQYNPEARGMAYGSLKRAYNLGIRDGGSGEGELENLQRRERLLIEELTTLEKDVRSLDEAFSKCDADEKDRQRSLTDLKHKSQAHVHVRKRMADKLRTQQSALDRDEKSPDPLAQSPVLQARISKLTKDIIGGATKSAQMAHEQWRAFQEAGLLDLAVKEADMQIRRADEVGSLLRETLRELEGRLAKARALQASAEKHYRSARERISGEGSCVVTPAERADLESRGQFQRDTAEVAAEAEAKQDSADALECNDPNVANEYRTRQRNIDTYTRQSETSTAALAAAETSLDTKQGLWLPQLKGMVEAINATFTKNFASIGCVGEIQLQEDVDYDKFAIQIRVKFRENEDLQLLNGTRQSGGERSVSTILYLIALQGITVTPFRVVDEINQGMDPINERKVFIHLVESSCRPGTPQCFLLTPKLLPGLPFTHDIHTLIIMNGSQIEAGLPTKHDMVALGATVHSGPLLASCRNAERCSQRIGGGWSRPSASRAGPKSQLSIPSSMPSSSTLQSGLRGRPRSTHRLHTTSMFSAHTLRMTVDGGWVVSLP
ncbi:MAG: hypothetical protein WDW36_005436 [Sanguina aurantia]